MSRRLLFIDEWKPVGYARLIRYLKYMLKEFGIPFTELDHVSDIKQFVEQENVSLGLIIVSFDVICQIGFPSFPNIKYLGIYMDPIGNLTYYLDKHKHQFDQVYGSIVPFLMQHQFFRDQFPGKPVFSFYQGYVPYEDLNEGNFVDCKTKTIDVVAPGFTRDVPDRLEVIKELRKRGLEVADQYMFGNEFDDAMRHGKVSIYFPIFNTITTFHGQRTLWAINKQICCVSIESADTQVEQFYSSMGEVYVRVKEWNISTFCDVVTDLIRSGKWKDVGQQNYQRYKENYDGVKIFDRRLLKFLRDFTCSLLPTINPMNEIYHVPKVIEKRTELMEFTPTPSDASKSISFRQQLYTKYQMKFKNLYISSAVSFYHCFMLIADVLQLQRDSDIILATKRSVSGLSESGFQFKFIDQANGSLNVSILDLQHKLKDVFTKLIWLRHEFGVPIDLKEFISESKNNSMTIVEDCSMTHTSTIQNELVGSLKKSIYIFQACPINAALGFIILWPNKTLFDRASKSQNNIPICEWCADQVLQRFDAPFDRCATNYKFLSEELSALMETFISGCDKPFPFQSWVLPSNVVTSYFKFPILIVDNTYEPIIKRFVEHLKTYNIQSEPITENKNILGIALPCGYWLNHMDMEYMLDVVEDFFEIL